MKGQLCLISLCVCVQVYGVFYATSFLDLYRSPHQVQSTSLTLSVTVDSGEQYLFLVSHSWKLCKIPSRMLLDK